MPSRPAVPTAVVEDNVTAPFGTSVTIGIGTGGSGGSGNGGTSGTSGSDGYVLFEVVVPNE